MSAPVQRPASNSEARKREASGPCFDASHAVAAFAGVPVTKPRYDVIEDVLRERTTQEAKWGEQNHPDGAGSDLAMNEDIGAWDDATNAEVADLAKERTDALAAAGLCTYAHVLCEEFWEALACDTPIDLREELVQVAAVAVAWVEKIDRDAARSAS